MHLRQQDSTRSRDRHRGLRRSPVQFYLSAPNPCLLFQVLARALAASIRRKRRSGVTGNSLISIPSGDSASATALATTAGAPMVPPSPIPRKPPSVVGDSASRWTTSIGGISHAEGTR